MIDAFASNLGFFLLVPLLAVQLTHSLGWTAFAAGLILAIRQFAQQGLAPWGGSIADRLGYRMSVMLGMEIRALGFVLFAFASTGPGLIAAALLAGLGGALFGPADAAALAVSVDSEDRQRVYSLRTVFANAGMVLGPLVGAYLLTVSFALVAWLAGLMFFVAGIFTWLFYPKAAQQPLEQTRSFLQGWRRVLQNKPFVRLTAVLSGYYLLNSQLYILIPLAVLAEHGPTALIGWLFAIYSGLAIALQTTVTRRVEHLPPQQQMTAGLLCTALGMLAALLPSAFALAATMVLFAFGTMLVTPAMFQAVADLADPESFGLFFGFSRLSLGFGGSIGNAVGGLLFTIGQSMGFLGLPWLILTVCGGVSTFGMHRSDLGDELRQSHTGAASHA